MVPESKIFDIKTKSPNSPKKKAMMLTKRSKLQVPRDHRTDSNLNLSQILSDCENESDQPVQNKDSSDNISAEEKRIKTIYERINENTIDRK